MAVKIGHSSIDENGKIAGGAAGDSTGKEVCIRKWYNGRWGVVLRPKSSALAEKSAKACEAGCNNPKIGYDQNQRNTLNTKAKAVGYDLAKITDPCECDCSAFMHVCAIAGGAGLSYGSNGCTTRSMVAAFVKSGDYEKLTASKYLTSDKYLQRGDILVREGSHTVMVLENGAAAGNTSAAKKEDAKKEDTKMVYPTLKEGDTGPAVKSLQILLIGYGYDCGKYGADGDYGKDTKEAVKRYQAAKGLTVDGKAGPDTLGSLYGLK